MGMEVGNNSTTNLIKFSDRIFAIFKKEISFYKRQGGNVYWVGHPMIDLTKNYHLRKIQNNFKTSTKPEYLTFNACIKAPRVKIYTTYLLENCKKITVKVSTLVVHIPSCEEYLIIDLERV